MFAQILTPSWMNVSTGSWGREKGRELGEWGGGGKVAAGSPGTEGMKQRDALLHPLTPYPEDGGESPRRRRHFVLYFSSLQGRR